MSFNYGIANSLDFLLLVSAFLCFLVFVFAFFFFFQHGVILSRLLTSFGDNFRTVRLCLSKKICVVCRYSRNEYIRVIRQVTCNVSVLILLLIPTVSNGTHYYNDHYKPPTFTS